MFIQLHEYHFSITKKKKVYLYNYKTYEVHSDWLKQHGIWNFDKFDPNQTCPVTQTNTMEINYLSSVNMDAQRPLLKTVPLKLY